MKRWLVLRYIGLALLTTALYTLPLEVFAGRNDVGIHSGINETWRGRKQLIVPSWPPDSGRKVRPSVLIIKVFETDISKPLRSAVALITSKNTNKTEPFTLLSGQLERTFTTPDVLSIEVSAAGYSSVKRVMTIALSPTGNRYEFDAELDRNTIGLTVWAVDNQTHNVIRDAHFTVSEKAGGVSVALTTDTTTGLSKIELPGKGTYLLSSRAKGYSDFSKSIVLDSAQNEARFILAAKQPLAETKPPAIRVASIEKPVVKTTPTVPVATSITSVSVTTTKPFGEIERGRHIQLHNLYFDQSSPILRQESYTELDQLYAVLIENPSVQIEIRGHTDNQGDFDLNTKLSRDRCQAVIDYLVGKGISKSRLRAIGRGPIDPVAPNNNEENRRKNRRVEFVVL